MSERGATECQRVREREARDLEILNRVADELNLEMEDVLTYQNDLPAGSVG